MVTISSVPEVLVRNRLRYTEQAPGQLLEVNKRPTYLLEGLSALEGLTREHGGIQLEEKRQVNGSGVIERSL